MGSDPSALTAKNWDAARRSLGRGSWSLLTGTSAKVLDSIAQDYADRAELTDTPTVHTQESP